jgi:TfoX/Sxy family transcriptional regulator of competence genes
MFGGVGYFTPNGGIFAAVVTEDDLVLKFVLGPERDALLALGGHPWVYDGGGKAMTMREWIVIPGEFYDDTELLRGWLERAHRSAPSKRPRPTASRPKAEKPKKNKV